MADPLRSLNHPPRKSSNVSSVLCWVTPYSLSSPTIIISIALLLLNQVTISHQLDFSIDKLNDYNSLAACFGQIHKDFEACNTRIAKKAKSFISNVELNSEWTKRLKCCGAWKLRDCWMKAANEKCTKEQAEQVFKLPNLFIPGLEEECGGYTPESGNCSFPLWLLILGTTVIIVLVLVCCCIVICCIRKFKNHSRFKRNNRAGYSQPSLYTVSSNKAIYQNGNSHLHRKSPPNELMNNEECKSLNDKQDYISPV